MEQMKYCFNEMPKGEKDMLDVMSKENANSALKFHKSIPGYQPTPLVNLKKLASKLNVESFAVKDESYRFELNSFKVLGGSYAMAKYIAKVLGVDISELDFETLISPATKEKIGEVSFYTATDGNHGRAVAWAAKKLGQKAFVYMPKGTSKARLDNILSEGAFAQIEQFNYDECVRKAAAEAAKVKNGVVVQDTAWEGYQDIPSWIMQGYGTIPKEADEQFNDIYGKAPTHVFVQAGVGSFASAVQGYFSNQYKQNCPKVIVVEANAADCFYKGALDGSGRAKIVSGEISSIMAGLACGEPNTISWEILRDNATCFVSCPDWVSAFGMRVLAAPIKGDTNVVSGESGAVPAGTAVAIMLMDEYKQLREGLCLDENSRVLCFSTEGDTDPEMYQKIVWSSEWNG